MANVTVTECLSKPTSQLAAERRSQGKQGPTFAICVCFYITVSALSTDFDTFSDLILVYCFLRAVLCPALSIAAACCSLWSANNWHSKSRASASVEAPRVADELLAARYSLFLLKSPTDAFIDFPNWRVVIAAAARAGSSLLDCVQACGVVATAFSYACYRYEACCLLFSRL